MSNIICISPASTIQSLLKDFSLAVREGAGDALKNMASQQLQIAFSGKEDIIAEQAKAA